MPGHLDTLRPEEIGGLFDRRHSIIQRSVLRHLNPKFRFFMIGIVGVFLILALATNGDTLIGSEGTASALSLIASPRSDARSIDYSLLQDPVAIVVIFASIATPIFCEEQVLAIRDFVPLNEANISYRSDKLRINEINTHVASANRRFKAIGSYPASIVLALASGLVSCALYSALSGRGLLASWNPTSMTTQEWRRMVYSGWWANAEIHVELAVTLVLFGAYFFYFLVKQLAMGCVFAIFARSTMLLEFGVAPNLAYNSDGYWGLRSLRRFMQWTYGSSLLHFAAALGVFIVWLPFAQQTVFMAIGVMLANGLTVVYPSSIAYRSAVREKHEYIQHVIINGISDADIEVLAEKIWNTIPSLPFRTRSTLSAVIIYLLVPTILAVVSSLLNGS